MAMILWNAKDQCEAYAGQKVKDVVITVPAYFGQAERQALQDASTIVGLNLLQVNKLKFYLIAKKVLDVLNFIDQILFKK